MKLINVYDDKNNKLAMILFNGKSINIHSDNKKNKTFIEYLINNDRILSINIDERFNMIPERYSNLSRLLFSNIKRLRRT